MPKPFSLSNDLSLCQLWVVSSSLLKSMIFDSRKAKLRVVRHWRNFTIHLAPPYIDLACGSAQLPDYSVVDLHTRQQAGACVLPWAAWAATSRSSLGQSRWRRNARARFLLVTLLTSFVYQRHGHCSTPRLQVLGTGRPRLLRMTSTSTATVLFA